MMYEKIHVLIILQSHSKGDSQVYAKLTDQKRFCSDSKAEVTRRCSRSLVDTINHCVETKHVNDKFEFELVVYDDHSDPESVSDIKYNLSLAKFKTQFIPTETYGIMPSILKCYEHGRDYGKDIVYFAQDDYLYDTTALSEMLDVMAIATKNTNSLVSIFPYDDPAQYYIPVNVWKQSHIMKTPHRHWRTQNATASCFMTFHQIIIDNWDLFYKMGTHEINEHMEDKTINQLFQTRGYHLLVPMPSVALHMQYDTEIDELVDWKKWWDRYPKKDSLLHQSSN